MDNLVDLFKNMSIKEGLDDAWNLDVEASNQIDGSGRIANQMDVHQVTSSRSGLADMPDTYQDQMVILVKSICTMYCWRIN